MKKYYHYYGIIFTADASIFDREFTGDEYESIDFISEESSHDIDIRIDTIKLIRPDINRICVLYNVYEYEVDTEEDKCLTCNVILDIVKNKEGEWNPAEED